MIEYDDPELYANFIKLIKGENYDIYRDNNKTFFKFSFPDDVYILNQTFKANNRTFIFFVVGLLYDFDYDNFVSDLSILNLYNNNYLYTYNIYKVTIGLEDVDFLYESYDYYDNISEIFKGLTQLDEFYYKNILIKEYLDNFDSYVYYSFNSSNILKIESDTRLDRNNKFFDFFTKDVSNETFFVKLSENNYNELDYGDNFDIFSYLKIILFIVFFVILFKKIKESR